MRPIRQLEGFQRIHLKPGESKVVNFTLSARQLSMINGESKRVIEEGVFSIHVGGEQPGFDGKLQAETTEVVTGEFQVIGNQELADL